MAHRRLITPKFLTDVHQALEPEGKFVTQTDNPDYWHYLRKILPVFFDFREQDGPWPDAPQGRSRREILARSRGLQIFRGEGVRRDVTIVEARRFAETLPPPRFVSRGPWLDLDAIEMREER